MANRWLAKVLRHDPQIPGDTHLGEVIVGFVSSFIAAALMAALAMATGMPFIFPSLGATVFLLFYRATASAAAPRNVLIGHLIGVIAGWFSLWVFNLHDHPLSLLQEGMTDVRIWAAALSLGLTSALMIAFRVAHPPAGATTLIVSLGLIRGWQQLAILMLAVALVLLVAACTHRLFGARYPLWKPLDE